MIKACPRCGFKQPEDQYCASCGVDMIAFQPKPKSSILTFFSSGKFVFIIISLIAGTIAYYLTHKNKNQSWVQKVSYQERLSVRSNTDSNSESVSAQSYASSSDSSQLNAVQNPTPNEQNIQVELASSVNAQEFVNPSNRTDSKKSLQGDTTLKSGFQLKLSFVEIPREILFSWSNESQRLGLYQSATDFTAGVIPPLRTREQFKELKTEAKKIEVKKPEALLFGKTSEETSEFSGLQINYEITSTEQNLIKGHVSIAKQNKQGKDTFPVEIELQKNSVFFINWKQLMTGFEGDAHLQQTAPFQILQSTDFMNQKTDLILILEVVDN